MSTRSITLTFDVSNLDGYTDEFVAALWHAAQANPLPIHDPEAGELAEQIGREIIRRWLTSQQPALWNHQGAHADRCKLRDLRAQVAA